ncbi:MAG: alpha/beta fold hydrolase [Candidatus Eisenbacteria bacterium]|uniref:Alpha/beta fold hydrolase n=1 Tax=Eiseniibacteriota bacterium TaxID=2212470 RepID=A0A538U2N5_UNCEI|nr:MAG: alpha/beta fold hydrolase [Candidatus Eisenbacteria bacterium]
MRALLGLGLAILGVGTGAAAEMRPEVGNYRLAVDHVIAVANWEVDPASPHVLLFTDFRTGRIGVLREAGKDEWVLPTRLMSEDEEARLRFARRAGRIVSLVVTEPGQPSRRAERIALRSHEVSFGRGASALRGTLWFPPGDGPFPAIVVVPAGAVGRAAAAPFVHFFLSEGFAVLAYDRRAERAPFPTYADDAADAVEMLRRRPEIDPRCVGLWGHSQGGWLALIAAARSKTAAFVIDHSGMMVPAWRQELDRLEAEALADSVPIETVHEAVGFETRLMRVAASGEGWAQIAAELDVKPARAWRALVIRPASLAELQEVWRDDFSFDPRPFVAGLRRPVLALFGGLDRSTPIESASQLVRSVGPAGTVEVDFFPTADHAFLDASTGGNAEIPQLRRFAPAMFDTLRRWLKRRRPSGTPRPR